MKKDSGKNGNGRASHRSALQDLLLEALETEIGGVDVYETALECVSNEELREEWQKYLDQTRRHVEIVTEICSAFRIDPNLDTPGRQIVRTIGKALVKAMSLALGSASPEAAQRVAAECVVHAEMKDHMNWQLLTKASRSLHGDDAAILRRACGQVEEEEDEHLYHSQGWARELATAALGLKAILPPPEERDDVKSAAGAASARAKAAKPGAARRASATGT